MSAQEFQSIISPKFTEEVLQNIITKKSGLSAVIVKNIEIDDTSLRKGDSNLSTVCRFTIKATGKNKLGQEENVSVPVITKFFPKSVARRKTFQLDKFFENETIFYEKVWVPFEKFQHEAQIEEKFDNVAEMLAAYSDGENDFISMLDYSRKGYKSVDRGIGLDYDHAIAFLKVLAGFHGLSLAFKEKQPENFEKVATRLKETYFSEKQRAWYCNFQQLIFTVVRDAVEKELPPEYLQKLNKLLSNDFYGLQIKSCTVRSRLSVVTHGDVWIPNFLVKYEGSKPGHIVMIDFQLTRYTTLVTDLAFFLWACVDQDLAETQWDNLIAHYHKFLNESLQKYKSKNVVTLEEIHKEMKKYSALGIGMSMEALIGSVLGDDEVVDNDNIPGEDALPLETVWAVRPLKTQEKRMRIARMIKMAVDKNYI